VQFERWAPRVGDREDAPPIGEDRGSCPNLFTDLKNISPSYRRGALGRAATRVRAPEGVEGGDRQVVGGCGESVDYRAARERRARHALLPQVRAPFFLCSRDYRGQAYCGDHCRLAARALSARTARRRHERSDAGRLDHRDRQRAYRVRLRTRVTDQASPVGTSPPKVSRRRSESAAPDRRPVPAGLPTCARCGCTSAWVQRRVEPWVTRRSGVVHRHRPRFSPAPAALFTGIGRVFHR
jgi:hypothetical protein